MPRCLESDREYVGSTRKVKLLWNDYGLSLIIIILKPLINTSVIPKSFVLSSYAGQSVCITARYEISEYNNN